MFIRNSSPPESNHRLGSSIINVPQRGPSADIDWAGLENGDAEHSPPMSNSPRPSMGKWILRPKTKKALRPKRISWPSLSINGIQGSWGENAQTSTGTEHLTKGILWWPTIVFMCRYSKTAAKPQQNRSPRQTLTQSASGLSLGDGVAYGRSKRGAQAWSPSAAPIATEPI